MRQESAQDKKPKRVYTRKVSHKKPIHKQSRNSNYVTNDYLDAKLEALEYKLESKFAQLETRLLKWLIGSIIVSSSTIIALMRF